MQVSELTKALLDDVDRRWKSGLMVFYGTTLNLGQKLDNGLSLAKHKKTIRTAVYGDVHLDEDELFILDSFFLQRLRNISQMGLLHFVFPEARHSRFEHSLGVLWRTKQLLQTVHLSPRLETFSEKLRFAALLHDIGHGPFSHTSEKILQTMGVDRRLRGEGRYHESRCKTMLTDTTEKGHKDFQLRRLGLVSYGLRAFFEKLDCPPSDLARLINGDRTMALAPIINGPIDVDKLDYFRRDAYYTGAAPGGVDAERLIGLMRWNDRLCFDEKGIRTLLQFIYARYFTSETTIFHPVVRTVEAMLIVAFDVALEILDDAEVQGDVLGHLELMDDSDLMRFLEIAATPGATDTSNPKRSILEDILRRLNARGLWKRIAMLSADEFLKMLDRPDLGQVFEDYLEREILWFVAGEDIPKSLQGGFTKTFPIALALTPQPRSKERTERMFKEVFISDDPSGVSSSLYTKCSADSHVQALTALQKDLWNVLILGPEEWQLAVAKSRKTRDDFVAWIKGIVKDPTRVRPSPTQYVAGLSKFQKGIIQ